MGDQSRTVPKSTATVQPRTWAKTPESDRQLQPSSDPFGWHSDGDAAGEGDGSDLGGGFSLLDSPMPVQPQLQRQPQEESDNELEDEFEIQAKCASCEAEEALQRQPESDLEAGLGDELGIQEKLSIGQPGDRYEQEADSVAAQVMKMPDPSLESESLQRQELGDSETEDTHLQTQPLAGQISQGVQLKAAGQSKGNQASAGLETSLKNQSGKGQPLGQETRNFMESRFGSDLGGVRVHTDEPAVKMNREVGAKAFTHGQDIYFNSGQYNPGSSSGKELFAHELTHTHQQSGGKIHREPEIIEAIEVESEDEIEDLDSENPQEEGEENSSQDRDKTDTGESVMNDAGTEDEENNHEDQLGPVKTELNKIHDLEEDVQSSVEKAQKNDEGLEKEQGSEVNLEDSQEDNSEEEDLDEENEDDEDQSYEEPDNHEESDQEEEAKEVGKQSAAQSKASSETLKEATQTESDTSQTVKFKEPSEKPVFLAPESSLGILQPSEMLGSAGNGMIAYHSDHSNESEVASGLGVPVQEIPASDVASYRHEQNHQAEEAISAFMASKQERKNRISQAAASIQPRITDAALIAKGSIQAAMAQSRSLVINKISQAKAQAEDRAASAKERITEGYHQTIDSIKQSTETNREKLTQEHEGKLTELEDIRASLCGRFDPVFASGQEAFREQGYAVSGEVDQFVNAAKNRFDSEEPPEPSNVVTEVLESFDRENYVKNWRNAKKEAAEQVGDGYKDSLKDVANEAAEELLEGKTEILHELDEVIDGYICAITAHYQDGLNRLDKVEAYHLEVANESFDAELQAVDFSLHATSASLDDMQASRLHQINSQGGQAQSGIDGQANQKIVKLQNQVSSILRGLDTAYEEFIQQFQGSEAPELEVVQSIILQIETELNNLENTGKNKIESGIQDSEQKLSHVASATVRSIVDIGKTTAEASSGLVQDFMEGIEQQVSDALEVFSELESSHDTLITSTVDETLEKFENDINQLRESLDECIDSVGDALEESAQDFRTDLSSSLTNQSPNLEQTIDQEADEAADKVEPAWKSVVKFVINVVIDLAVVLLITALVASGVGLLVGVALAAIIGGVGAVLKQAGNDVVDGEMSSVGDYGREFGIGAASGVLQFVGGKAVKGVKGIQAKSKAGKLGKKSAEYGVQTSVDVSQEFVVASFYEDYDFNLGEAIGASLVTNITSEGLSTLGSNKLNKDNKLIRKIAIDTVSDASANTISDVGIRNEDLSTDLVVKNVSESLIKETGTSLVSHRSRPIPQGGQSISDRRNFINQENKNRSPSKQLSIPEYARSNPQNYYYDTQSSNYKKNTNQSKTLFNIDVGRTRSIPQGGQSISNRRNFINQENKNRSPSKQLSIPEYARSNPQNYYYDTQSSNYKKNTNEMTPPFIWGEYRTEPEYLSTNNSDNDNVEIPDLGVNCDHDTIQNHYK